MLGTPALETEHGAAVPGLGPGKPLAVVCYLAVQGSARRDELVALLWGDVQEKRARNAFRQSLHRLRSAVPGLLDGDGAERVQLAPQSVETDLEAFDAAIRSHAWQTALDLYRGDFLEGLDLDAERFREWIDEVRERVRAQWWGALVALARSALDAGELDSALGHARELLGSDPANQEAILIEAQALALGGRSAEAAALLERHRERLQRDFGAALSPACMELFDRLRTSSASGPNANLSKRPIASVSAAYAEHAARMLQTWRRVVAEHHSACVLLEARAPAEAHALVRDVTQRISATGPALVLRGHEPTAGESVAYASVAEALRGALRAPGLAGVSDHLLAEAARLVPELRDRFSLPPAGPIADEAARVRVFDSVAAMIEALAFEQPVCIVLEDLERASASTIDLLAYLIRRVASLPVMFICTTRPSHSPVARLVREHVVTERESLAGPRDDTWLQPPPAAAVKAASPAVGMALYAGAFALLVMAATLAWSALRSAAGVTGPDLVLPDTLLLADAAGVRAAVLSGDVDAPQMRTRAYQGMTAEPPWLNPRPAPVGELIAMERLSPSGADIYLINGTDTTALAATPADDLIGGWSPDGRRVLVLRGDDTPEGYHAGLWSYPVDGGTPTAIDTARSRTVVEAVWSPTGTRIAWVARAGPELQRDVFFADADGGRLRNVSVHDAEDYHVAWSPDGARVAFTSDRHDNAEIFARELSNWDLWRITFDPAHDDGALFSSDGELLVFESTRGGSLGVYAVRSYGGEPHALLADAAGMRIRRWLTQPPAYIDDVQIRAPTMAPGDSVQLAASVRTSIGEEVSGSALAWHAPDSGVVALHRSGDSVMAHARSAGAARLIAGLQGWRSDTAIIVVGTGPATWIADDFDDEDAAQWRVLGRPTPIVRDGAMLLRADREWQSGILADRLIPLDRSVDVDAIVSGPFDGRAPMSFTIALIEPGSLDAVAPQPVNIASLEWDGSAGRLTFNVGPESASEPVPRSLDRHVLTMRLQPDGRVAFLVDGVVQTTSSLQLRDLSQAQLWIGGIGTGDAVRVESVRVRIGGAVRQR